MKITRDAFLYLAPCPPYTRFAQCGTCRFHLPTSLRCGLIGSKTVVPPTASCGFYVHGIPTENQSCESSVTVEESGLVDRPVRCENCLHFEVTSCGLFATLNEVLPDDFDLDEAVSPQGCCNAQTPIEEVKKLSFNQIFGKEFGKELLRLLGEGG